MRVRGDAEDGMCEEGVVVGEGETERAGKHEGCKYHQTGSRGFL